MQKFKNFIRESKKKELDANSAESEIPKAFNDINSSEYPAAQQIASKLKNILGEGTLEKFSGTKVKTSDEWQKWTSKSIDEPKTDWIFDDGKNKKRISVKESSGSQLMSGHSAEAKATFNAALNKMSAPINKEIINKLIDAITDIDIPKEELLKVFKKLKYGDEKSKEELRRLIMHKTDMFDFLEKYASKSNILKKFYVDLKQKDEDMKKIIDETLNKYIDDNMEELKKQIVIEAATGNAKFDPNNGGDENGRAEYFVIFDKKEGTVILENIGSSDYTKSKIDKIKVKYRARWKHGIFTAFAIDVLPMDLSDELEEGVVDTVKQYYYKLKNWIISIIKKISDFLSKSATELLSFLGIDFDVSITE